MVIRGPEKGPKLAFFPTHCFYTSPGICRRFWTEVLTQTPKNAVFHPRSYSKGPNHALEKVLTKETPGMFEVEHGHELSIDLVTELWDIMVKLRMFICHESLLRHQCKLNCSVNTVQYQSQRVFVVVQVRSQRGRSVRE